MATTLAKTDRKGDMKLKLLVKNIRQNPKAYIDKRILKEYNQLSTKYEKLWKNLAKT